MVVLGAVAAYWNYSAHHKAGELTQFAQPFQAACNTDSGCLLSPAGWERMGESFRLNDHGEWTPTSETAFFQGTFEYVANRNDFELRWHIATDVYLVARGGAGAQLVVIRVVA